MTRDLGSEQLDGKIRLFSVVSKTPAAISILLSSVLFPAISAKYLVSMKQQLTLGITGEKMFYKMCKVYQLTVKQLKAAQTYSDTPIDFWWNFSNVRLYMSL